MSKFFINRPIFATVIALLTLIAGLVTLSSLPIEQYPEIAPPTISVEATYPGASSNIVADTVAAPIEQEVNGVENMLYMSSVSSNNGAYSLTVTFELGTDMDMATVLVQNRVKIAEPKLPEEVKRLGITVEKQSTNIVQMVVMSSPDKIFDELYLANYAKLRLQDELSRLDGVGKIMIFGADDYSMRIWLNPDKLKVYGLTVSDVTNAIKEQNIQVAAGQIGQSPTNDKQSFQYTINTRGRLQGIEEFQNVIVKTEKGGRFVRIKDIARVELDSRSYSARGQLNGEGAALLLIYQSPGSNALALAKSIEIKMEELSKSFPQGLEYSIPYDTTKFVESSIEEVIVTLIIAILLVFVVIFIFLQDWRATLIPAVTIPVSLIGTFAAMQMFGFTINMLTLFGIILAIGIVVDDAIVVVENTVRNIDEYKMSSKDAALKAMEEVTGPIVATTLVLLAVFVPTAFMSGISGVMYKQFALTIAASTFFSSINALTLSPALSAILLRPTPEHQNFFFRGFNKYFDIFRRKYDSIIGFTLRKLFIMVILFFILVFSAGYGFKSLPTGFIPSEDQGYVIAAVMLPDASSFERTKSVVKQINETIKGIPGIANWISVPGFSLLDGTMASNGAAIWIIFDPWEERQTPELQQDKILEALNKAFYSIRDANIFAFVPPPIAGLGTTGGFEIKIQDRSDVGLNVLNQMTLDSVASANGQTGLSKVYTQFRVNIPQLFADIDRVMAKNMNISLSEIFGSLQAYLGSSYINDFNKFGRTYQVVMQADHEYRNAADDIKNIQVRSLDGKMIPMGAFLKLKYIEGPQIINRYNLYPSATINGSPATGFSSGQSIAIMENMLNSELPDTMGYEWTGTAFQEKEAGGGAIFILLLSILLVYLVLCAQYESWTLPLGVVLAVPLALVGTVIAVLVRGMDINIYSQIGIILLIALASKNAILIVEFAKEEYDKGLSITEAAAKSASLRLRPILMTSFAFILGVFPLVIAAGAGAASRQALGTTVFGGMIAATFLTVIFVPFFFTVIQKIKDRKGRKDNIIIDTKIDSFGADKSKKMEEPKSNKK